LRRTRSDIDKRNSDFDNTVNIVEDAQSAQLEKVL